MLAKSAVIRELSLFLKWTVCSEMVTRSLDCVVTRKKLLYRKGVGSPHPSSRFFADWVGSKYLSYVIIDEVATTTSISF